MQILGFIPARSGSTRLKNKNLKSFLGKPLLYHTVKFVKKLKLSHILVSSDSKKIKNIELKLNIKNNYLRPKKLSNKNSQLTDAIFDALNWLFINKKKKFDAVMVFQPTTPYRDLIETKKIIRLFKKKKLDSLATVSKVDEHPQFIYRVNKGKNWDYILKKRVNSLNKQDLEENFFYENGHIYLCSVKFLKKNKKFIIKDKTFLFKQKIRTLDIDYLQDFKICEFRVKNRLFA
jgi:CMP-N,N'-diacetyllegionaminic acid synthase